jgi:hypothetical protein
MIMKNWAGRVSAGLAGTAVAAVVLAGGCSGQETRPTAAPESSVAPTTAKALTGEELRWIRAAEQLLPTMNGVFTTSPSDLTPSALRAMANGARACSRELARVGDPGNRLQPSYVLVQRACQEYDRGAKCFADAARMGVPSGSAEIHTFEQRIDCGFAASEKGGKPLAEARVKAAEIAAAAG